MVAGKPLPPGWAGKPWAMQQGIDIAVAREAGPEYVLLTDADVTHAAHVLDALVSRAAAGNLVLVSVMATLRCRSPAERFAIPAFVYFFRMLYPFAWVADEARPTAAAAGGCMLLRAEDLRDVGGFRRIADAIIDDCALSRLMKPRGRLWLGLSRDVVSVRPYRHLATIRRDGHAFRLHGAAPLAPAPPRSDRRNGVDLPRAAAAAGFLVGSRRIRRCDRLHADDCVLRPDAALLRSAPGMGGSSAGRGAGLHGVDGPVGNRTCAWARGQVEGALADTAGRCAMTEAAALRSGKTYRTENFPVASRLLGAEHRAPIMAFYNFVRTADDVADHRAIPPTEKFALLDRLEAGLLGDPSGEPEGHALRSILLERELDLRHAREMLVALPAGRDALPVSDMERARRLLPLFGNARRPLRARRVRGAALHLAGLRCLVHGPAGDQPSAGLRRGLPQSQPRLSAARDAAGTRCEDRGAGRRSLRRRAPAIDRRLVRPHLDAPFAQRRPLLAGPVHQARARDRRHPAPRRATGAHPARERSARRRRAAFQDRVGGFRHPRSDPGQHDANDRAHRFGLAEAALARSRQTVCPKTRA